MATSDRKTAGAVQRTMPQSILLGPDEVISMIRALLNFSLVVLAACIGSFGLPSTADAQQMASPRRIGILVAGASSVAVQSVIEELQHLGYDEGRNLTVELRNAENKPARLPIWHGSSFNSSQM